MASPFPNTKKKKNTSLPPRRGQIKAQIFESLANTVMSTVSKVAGALGGVGGSHGNSAPSTPPPSTYNTDGSSDI